MNELPSEILMRIVEYSDINTVIQFSQCSKWIYKVLSQDEIWGEVCNERKGKHCLYYPKENLSWKETYFRLCRKKASLHGKVFKSESRLKQVYLERRWYEFMFGRDDHDLYYSNFYCLLRDDWIDRPPQLMEKSGPSVGKVFLLEGDYLEFDGIPNIRRRRFSHGNWKIPMHFDKMEMGYAKVVNVSLSKELGYDREKLVKRVLRNNSKLYGGGFRKRRMGSDILRDIRRCGGKL